jgi:hypothetical protein
LKPSSGSCSRQWPVPSGSRTGKLCNSSRYDGSRFAACRGGVNTSPRKEPASGPFAPSGTEGIAESVAVSSAAVFIGLRARSAVRPRPRRATRWSCTARGFSSESALADRPVTMGHQAGIGRCRRCRQRFFRSAVVPPW